MAESFVDTLKTELIADRVWRTRSQLELAIVEWVGWYNTRRLHSELGDVPPVEFEQAHLATSGPVDHRAGGISLRSPSGLARLCLARRTGVSALAGQTLAWDDNRKLRPNAGRVALPTKATLLRDLDRECCFAPWLLHKPPANPLDRF